MVNLDLLSPDFKIKVNTLLNNCITRGAVMRPTEGLRHPLVQARYWRRGKTDEQVEQEINRLQELGAPFLAYCIHKVGPQEGKHITNAIPGLSWHQWGEALDCYWLVDSKAVWDINMLINNINGYTVYAEEAKQLGLDSGRYWKKLIDACHVQLRPADSPLQLYTLQEIDAAMYQRFVILSG